MNLISGAVTNSSPKVKAYAGAVVRIDNESEEIEWLFTFKSLKVISVEAISLAAGRITLMFLIYIFFPLYWKTRIFAPSSVEVRIAVQTPFTLPSTILVTNASSVTPLAVDGVIANPRSPLPPPFTDILIVSPSMKSYVPWISKQASAD